MDVYGLDYHSALVQRFEQRNIIVKSALLLLVLVAAVPRFVFRLFRRRNLGKGPTDKLQLFYGIAVLSLLVVYTGILLAAAYQLVLQAPSLVGGASSLPSITTPQVLAIGMALAGALFPKPKEQFSNAAVDLVATMRY